MKQPPRNWIEYWDQDDLWHSPPLWKINVELFYRRAEPIVGYRPDDAVLDIGCCAGDLERMLAPRVRSIVAVDTSARFVEMCRRNCADLPNVAARPMGEDYTDLTECGQSFSLILCVAVVQYYSDVGEVEALIRSAREVAAPGARMLIADVPVKQGVGGFALDALASLALSAKERYLRAFLAGVYTRFLRPSGYADMVRRRQVLKFTVAELAALIARMGLNARIVRDALSVRARRPSVLIHFD